MSDDEKEFWEKVNERIYVSEHKITELEDLIQSIGTKLDFTSAESGQALREIEELKEHIDSLFHSVRYQRIERIEEVQL